MLRRNEWFCKLTEALSERRDAVAEANKLVESATDRFQAEHYRVSDMLSAKEEVIEHLHVE